MRKFILAVTASILVLLPVAGRAQESGDALEKPVEQDLGQWNRNFLSPAYGVALFRAEIRQRGIPGVISSFVDEEILVTAADLRVFRGVNVSKRNGFYTGVEAGAFIFLPVAHSFSDDVTVEDPGYPPVPPGWVSGPFDFKAAPYGGLFFLMAKYGLRTDVGKQNKGIGAGLELGAGGSIYTGGFDLWMGDKDNPSVQVDAGSTETKISLIVDASAECSFRVGKNSRLFAKGSVMIMPLTFEGGQLSSVTVMNDGVSNTDPQYFEYALRNYELEYLPFVYGLRVGFTLSFD
jgi:hypothetical protein